MMHANRPAVAPACGALGLCMRGLLALLVGALAACGGDSGDAPGYAEAPAPPPDPRRPNILLIVADDLGYSDIGAFGSEIGTPHLDSLAADGRVLTQFHTGAVCAPTRAMLMSGAMQHRAGVGANPEVLVYMITQNLSPFGVNDTYNFRNVPPGYEGYLSDRALALPELLRDGGYEAIRAGRVDRLKALGLLPPNFAANPGLPGLAEGGTPRWGELTPDARKVEARLMETYAAMVTHMDRQIGRVIDHLKTTGQYDDTLILFMSDNGPDDGRSAPEGVNIDNSYDNLGRPGSTSSYGRRWAEASATPMRGWKGRAAAEGSSAVPAMVKLPAGAAAPPLTTLMHVTDLLPTLMEAARLPLPQNEPHNRTFVSLDGVSQWDALRSAEPVAVTRPHDGIIGGELMAVTGYVRDGHWKLSRLAPPDADAAIGFDEIPWQLFDMQADRGETIDLAASHPDIAQRLIGQWDAFAARNGIIMHTRGGASAP